MGIPGAGKVCKKKPPPKDGKAPAQKAPLNCKAAGKEAWRGPKGGCARACPLRLEKID